MTDYEFPQPLKLIGDFSCRLTSADSNRWAKFCFTSPEVLEYRRLEAASHARWAMLSQSTARQTELDLFFAAEKAVRDQCSVVHDIAAAWFAENVKGDQGEIVGTNADPFRK